MGWLDGTQWFLPEKKNASLGNAKASLEWLWGWFWMDFGAGWEFGLLFLLGAFLDLKGTPNGKSAHWRCHTKTSSSGNAHGGDIKWDIPLGVLEVRTPSREDAPSCGIWFPFCDSNPSP